MGPRPGLDALWKDMPLAPVKNRSQVLRRHHRSLVTVTGISGSSPDVPAIQVRTLNGLYIDRFCWL